MASVVGHFERSRLPRRSFSAAGRNLSIVYCRSADTIDYKSLDFARHDPRLDDAGKSVATKTNSAEPGTVSGTVAAQSTTDSPNG
jgi:hypothetical protein